MTRVVLSGSAFGSRNVRVSGCLNKPWEKARESYEGVNTNC